MRDDFPIQTKEILAKRVGYRCSNPSCRQLTTGPHKNQDKAVNVGVAAHITAASTGGPRFETTLTARERRAADNGIWLCQKCAKLIDNDTLTYTVDILRAWKYTAEQTTIDELRGRAANKHQDGNTINKPSTEQLSAYQMLYHAVKKASGIVFELFDTEEIKVGEKKMIISNIIMELAEITDENSFHLGHEVTVHAVGSFIGVDDILDIDDVDIKQGEIKRFSRNIRNTYRLIESLRDTGQIDPTIYSPLIEYFKERKKIQDIEDQIP